MKWCKVTELEPYDVFIAPTGVVVTLRTRVDVTSNPSYANLDTRCGARAKQGAVFQFYLDVDDQVLCLVHKEIMEWHIG